MAHLNGPIYAVGGLDDMACFNIVERYDAESDSWTQVQNMNYARGGVAVAAFRVKQTYRSIGTFHHQHHTQDTLVKSTAQPLLLTQHLFGVGYPSLLNILYESETRNN